MIIVSKKHPLLKTNNLKELENYDYYSREKGSSIYELVQSYFISYKLDIHPSIECVNPSSLIELVRYNNGFTILPSSLVKNEKEIALIKIKIFTFKEPIILSCTKIKNFLLFIKKSLN